MAAKYRTEILRTVLLEGAGEEMVGVRGKKSEIPLACYLNEVAINDNLTLHQVTLLLKEERIGSCSFTYQVIWKR